MDTSIGFHIRYYIKRYHTQSLLYDYDDCELLVSGYNIKYDRNPNVYRLRDIYFPPLYNTIQETRTHVFPTLEYNRIVHAVNYFDKNHSRN